MEKDENLRKLLGKIRQMRAAVALVFCGYAANRKLPRTCMEDRSCNGHAVWQA